MMRLWCEALIPYLDTQRLLGQHRECCALRGKGWGKKHSTVDYVFKHPYGWLVEYHYIVMHEMEHRGYKIDFNWWNCTYRGKILGFCEDLNFANKTNHEVTEARINRSIKHKPIYPEHNHEYLKECLEKLKQKGVYLSIGKGAFLNE